MLPSALNDVIDALGRLPGVGPRTAERYAYFLLKSDPYHLAKYRRRAQSARQRQNLSKNFRHHGCQRKIIATLRRSYARQKPRSGRRRATRKSFTGTYHVLGGAISPMDGITADKLHIKELIDRVEEDSVSEIIIATNPSVEGESTAVLLEKLLHEKYPDLKITRLARGLPLGVSLEYADQITLTSALKNRTIYNQKKSPSQGDF